MTEPLDVSWDQALAWRMRRQYLQDRAPAADLVGVVGRMCGLQAQVMSSVELALCARVDGLDRGAVQDALWRERTLVKLWGMRKTLHVFPSAGLGRWLDGFDTYREGPEWYGLRDPRMLELADLVGRALRDRVLTRTELAAEVGRVSGSADKAAVIHGSWGGSLKPAAFLGQLCFGPSDGQRVRFTHPDTWLPDALDQRDQREQRGSQEILARIARRYLGTYGPATPVELGAWWGVGRRAAARMLAALGDEATEIRVDGEPHWVLAEQLRNLASTTSAAGVVRMLPAFDQWVICANRRDGGGSRPGPGQPALDPAHRTRIYRQQGWVSPVLVVDGRIEGVWRHRRRGRRLVVEIDPFGTLPRWTRQPIEAEAERIADLLSGDLQLTRAG